MACPARYCRGMTDVAVFVDPSCPWAWITSRWVKDVAPQRDLVVFWRSYCLEIRDDYGVAPTVPPDFRQAAIAGHALSHRMLRIFEAARARCGEGAVDALYTEWGRRYFLSGDTRGQREGRRATHSLPVAWPGVASIPTSPTPPTTRSGTPRSVRRWRPPTPSADRRRRRRRSWSVPSRPTVSRVRSWRRRQPARRPPVFGTPSRSSPPSPGSSRSPGLGPIRLSRPPSAESGPSPSASLRRDRLHGRRRLPRRPVARRLRRRRRHRLPPSTSGRAQRCSGSDHRARG